MELRLGESVAGAAGPEPCLLTLALIDVDSIQPLRSAVEGLDVRPLNVSSELLVPEPNLYTLLLAHQSSSQL